MRRKVTGEKRNRKRQRRRSPQKRKFNRRPRSQRQVHPPRTAKQFWAMSKHDRDEWEKVTSVISEARATGKSPRKIAKGRGIEFETVRKKTGRVIRKRNGRYVVQPTDKLLRVLVIPARKGMREVATRDSRQATVVAEYWIAVHRYIDPESHDSSAIRKFEGKYVIDANGKRVRLLTNQAELDRLAGAGRLSFETIYAQR